MKTTIPIDLEIALDSELNRLTHAVIGAAIEVHRELGPGLLESVYENALAIELTRRQVPFSRQAIFQINYKKELVGEGRMDFLVANCLVVELKSIEELAPIHTAQVVSYLKSTHHRLGLLINFNVRVLKDAIRRIAN